MIRRGGSDADAARDRSLERDSERERRPGRSRRRLRRQHSEDRLDAQMRSMSIGAERCYACDALATGERAPIVAVSAATLTDDLIQKLRSTTTDPEIAECCMSALGIGAPIWSVRQCAREAVVEILNARVPTCDQHADPSPEGTTP